VKGKYNIARNRGTSKSFHGKNSVIPTLDFCSVGATLWAVICACGAAVPLCRYVAVHSL
jgi:hypothetical protein